VAENLSPLQRAALDFVIEARKVDASFIDTLLKVAKIVAPVVVKVTPTLVEAAVGTSALESGGPGISGDPGLDELIRYRESLR
jgi:hypothetical protein